LVEAQLKNCFLASAPPLDLWSKHERHLEMFVILKRILKESQVEDELNREAARW
jgi:hypothetical protein